MHTFSRGLPKTLQVCPMCHAQLPAGVLYCDACGTDLSRAGVLFSTSIRPVSRSGLAAGRAMRAAGLALGILAAVAIGLVGLGSVPSVNARVPAILTITAPIRDAFSQAVQWSSHLVSREREPGREREPSTQTVAPPAPQTLAPPAPQTVASVLTIHSTPPGADVYLNGTLMGKTPLTTPPLQPGGYTIKVARAGYASVSRWIELKPNTAMTVGLQMKRAAQPPRPAPPAARPPARQVGSLAPGFTLKDRRGVIYRLSDFRGRRLTLLVIWSLDDRGEHFVRMLQSRTGGRNAVVILIHPNRLALRRFLDTEPITVPILFGDEEIAAEYQVPEGAGVVFTIDEQGRIVDRRPAASR